MNFDWRQIGARKLTFIIHEGLSGQQHPLQFSLRGIALAALLAVAVPLTVGWQLKGYVDSYALSGQQLQDWGQQLDAQQSEIEQLTEDTQTIINGLTRRHGELQARLLRMESVGGRLLGVTGLQSDADFAQPPALGGPEFVGMETALAVPPHLLQLTDDLYGRVMEQQRRFTLLESWVDRQDHEQKRQPEGRPIVKGWVSSNYGLRVDPIHGRLADHKGVDFASHKGAPILAVASGIVTYAGQRSGYGRLVEVDHGDGLVTRYGHSEKLLVEKGQVVSKGDTIATVGDTGRSTGPHVHFEVLIDNEHVDPAPYIKNVRG